eukprot:m.1665000 g.1665000  ORF g.1665000 m.1665000 type:complete len:51 (+) comp140677_c0_seq1:56-208(+)
MQRLASRVPQVQHQTIPSVCTCCLKFPPTVREDMHIVDLKGSERQEAINE